MFEKIVYEDKRITAITVEWKDDFSEVISVLETFFNDNDTEHLMLDLRNSSLDTVTSDHIRDICKYAAFRTNENGKNGKNGVNCKTALIGASDLQPEIVRILNTCSDLVSSHINVSTFRSKEKALSWLEEG